MNSSSNQSSEMPELSPPRRPSSGERVLSPPTPSMPTEISANTSLKKTAEPIAPNPPKAAVPSEPEPSPVASPEAAAMRGQPIPPPSEPMQYRAIGLVRGQYTPSEEQFTRGALNAEDGTEIDAVLLGRVMSLVKNHLDLEKPHLWVVYPRTRQNDDGLHVQIVGVWEPENLNRDPCPASEIASEDSAETSAAEAVAEAPAAEEAIETPAAEETTETPAAEAATETPAAEVSAEESAADAESTVDSTEATDPEDNYFSIRGEVVDYSKENKEVIVKIKQAPRKDDGKVKFFKLRLEGLLSDRATGYFWDLRVQREANSLVIQQGNSVALVPPKKKKKNYRGGGRPGGKRPRSGYPSSRKGMRAASGGPTTRKESAPKPIIKRRDRSTDEGAASDSSS